jgi:hypothetical protein
MPTLEFATINLNPGVKPDDGPMISVLHSCIAEISRADGVRGMHFMKNRPEGSQEQILGLTGVWATPEAHAAYLHSGKITPLLMDLLPFITMRDILHLQVGDLLAAQEDLLLGEVLCAAFRVNGSNRGAFEKLVNEQLLAVRDAAVSGWKVKQEKSFKEAEDFGREKLGQEARQEEPTDVDSWVVFVKPSDRSLLEKIIEHSKSVTVDVEIQSWVGI